MELVVSRAVRGRTWLPAVRRLGAELGSRGRTRSLFTVGTPTYEPWHLTAHLQDAARWSGSSLPAPILARRQVTANAPAHLSVGIDDVVRQRDCTLLVVAPESADDELLERLSDVRRRGGVVFALTDDSFLATDDLMQVAQLAAPVAAPDFDLAQHLLPATVSGESSVWLPRRIFRPVVSRLIRA